jgi:hypothetical protein
LIVIAGAFRLVVRGCSSASAALERIPLFASRDLLMADAPDSAVAVYGDKERTVLRDRAPVFTVQKRKIDPALFGVGLRYQSALLYFVGDGLSANFAGKPAHRAL